MPNSEIILSKIKSLTPIEDFHWSKARGEQLWEGTEQGGHFHVFNRKGSRLIVTDTRADGWDDVPYRQTEVSISGSEMSKTNIEKNFVDVLGKPTLRIEKYHKTFLEWRTLVREV